MISYAPLWKTMKIKHATTYTLLTKGKIYNIGSATVTRLRKNQSVSTNTLDVICTILGCDLPDIIEYIPDEQQEQTEQQEQ